MVSRAEEIMCNGVGRVSWSRCGDGTLHQFRQSVSTIRMLHRLGFVLAGLLAIASWTWIALKLMTLSTAISPSISMTLIFSSCHSECPGPSLCIPSLLCVFLLHQVHLSPHEETHAHHVTHERHHMISCDLHKAKPVHWRTTPDCDSMLIPDLRRPIPAPGGRCLH